MNEEQTVKDLTELLTDLAEQKLCFYADNELKELVTTCNSFKYDTDCFDMYIVAHRGLVASLYSFIEGIEFFGQSVNTEFLRIKAQELIESFDANFYAYMQERNQL